MNTIIRLRTMATTALGLGMMLQGSLSWADDTEIFLNPVATGVKPNVFFILDDSGSMKYCLDNNKKCNKSGRGQTRLEVLQRTMDDLLSNLTDVNVGLMTFHRRQSLVVNDIDAVRTDALAKVYAMKPKGKTPLAEAMYDAATYFTDLPGKQSSTAALGVNVPSPITEECQPSHFILLTDGQANRNKVTPKIERLIDAGKNCIPRGASVKGGRKKGLTAGTCVPELAEWLNHTDQSAIMKDKQNVVTHTIGYALNADKNKVSIQMFLEDIAFYGGGQHHNADTADELTKAFKEIIAQAKRVENTSYAATSSSLQGTGFNWSQDKNQTYYPIFRATSYERWPGNLKRYGLTNDDKQIVLDINKKVAKDANGQFKADAQSWWSAEADGNNVNKGGAAWKLPDNPNDRNLWVSIGDTLEQFPTAQFSANGFVSLSSSSISSNLLDAQTDDERKQLLSYIRGFKADGEPRKELNDPLHSSPRLFAYQCQGNFNAKTSICNEPYDKENTSQMAIIGTNEGFVHMFDTATGIEQFAFMPDELLKNIKKQQNKKPVASEPRSYGMDNTVTVWINDTNNNGKVDGNDKVYAYTTMRRGGRSIYALDITDKNNPKLKWKITGGSTPGFERLGQTWSEPVRTKIDVAGKVTDVLIFGGGYDTAQDEPNNYRVPVSQGHDIYIVDALTGDKIWSASDLNLPDMKYSIPGNVRVISVSANANRHPKGLATHLFVGDTGGQVWRFFINNGDSGSTLVSAGANNGLFADLGGTQGSHNSEARRFYHGPDVALELSKGKNKLIVNIGSGYRAHPLDITVKDRQYSLHSSLTDDGKILRESDLAQATDLFDAAKIESEMSSNKSGWRIELQKPGQKVISIPKTVQGELFFPTFVPPTSAINPNNPCIASTGDIIKYHVRLSNAAPVKAGLSGSYDDYTIRSMHQGLPVDVKAVCFDGKCWIEDAPGEFSDPFSGAGPNRKTYWIDLAE